MIFYLASIVFGFALLVWSADRFVDGAASTAKHLGMPSLLIGILIWKPSGLFGRNAIEKV